MGASTRISQYTAHAVAIARALTGLVPLPYPAWVSPSAVSLATVLCAATLIAQSGQNPFGRDPKVAESGRVMFRIYCSPCHGIRAGGGRGPDLTQGVFSSGDRDQDLHRTISEGVPGSEMPGFEANLGSENIWRLVTYIRSVARRQPAPAKGDAAAGSSLFWSKAGCGQCHRVNGRGGRLGPDLTRVGRERSIGYLRASILTPNEDITTGYGTITVVTRDGRTIVGAQRGWDNFTVQLMDASEHIYSFDRAQVKSALREMRSLMPGAYGKRLSPAEIDNLVAYLDSLRGGL